MNELLNVPVSQTGTQRWLVSTRDESGQEIVEAAIVLPILFLVLLAIFWFGRAFNIRSTLQRAARQGIKTLSQNSCATCGNVPQAYSQAATSVTDALAADHLSSSDIVVYKPDDPCTPPTPPTCPPAVQGITICSGVPLTCGGAACQRPPTDCGQQNVTYGTRVSFGYQYKSPLPFGNLSQIQINGVALSAPEN